MKRVYGFIFLFVSCTAAAFAVESSGKEESCNGYCMWACGTGGGGVETCTKACC